MATGAGTAAAAAAAIEVAHRFRFVTFNGERIYEDTAAEKNRLWKAEGYI